MHTFPRIVSALSIALVAEATGCGHDDEGDDGGGFSGASSLSHGMNPASGAAEAEAGNEQGVDDPVVSIKIEPSHAVIVVDNGLVPAPLPLVAIGKTESGQEVDLAGSWSFDRPDIAEMAEDELSATGLAGGTGTVTFTADAGVQTTTATIKLQIVDEPADLDPVAKAAFDAANLPDPALDLLYPYDQTVFPRGLAAPILMWNGGGVTDLYRIRFRSNTYDFTSYTAAAPPSRYTLPTDPFDEWLRLTDSSTGPVTVEVQRFDGQKAYLPETRTWTISSANLRGAIYYWEVNKGDIVRLNPGDTAPQTFLKKEPGACVACHSVSRDGSTIAAAGIGGYSPRRLFDATSGDSLFTTDYASGFQAVSPEGEFVLWRQWSDNSLTPTSMVLSVADSDEPLAYLETPGGTPAHPSWAPDGQKIAFGVRTDGNGLDFTQSSLWLADIDIATPQFSNLRQIVGNDPTRPTLTYPTFSPDSQWIAFMRATQSRTRGAAAELWLTNLDGTAQLLLDAANGVDAVPPAQQHLNYEPTFSPVSAGGYFWLVFVSERTYGNLLTDEDPVTRRKQLWVTAIDAAPVAGEDPSHPSFWLPGQELDNHNMRGNWALSPCKGLGAPCEAGYECCEGFCIYDADAGGTVCGEPQSCGQYDDACATNADCCDELAVCIGGYCAQPYIP